MRLQQEEAQKQHRQDSTTETANARATTREEAYSLAHSIVHSTAPFFPRSLTCSPSNARLVEATEATHATSAVE